MNRHDDFVSPKVEDFLVSRISTCIADMPLRTHGGRSRIRRYGYDYDEEVRFIEPIPEWLDTVREALFHLLGFDPDSITLNEYCVGTGIEPHVDAKWFADPIAILSLNSAATMQLPNGEVFLPRRSLLVMAGTDRFIEHGIDARSYDRDDEGRSVERGLRYSVVFRRRILD